jgi:hypothetical protein
MTTLDNEKTLKLNDIYAEVFKLENPKISIKNNRDEEIKEFIKTTINGDSINTHLAINAYLKPKILGVILYILTSVRLIKIEIDKEDGISSTSFFLNTITSIDRKMINKDTFSIDIVFQTTSLGLRYDINNKKITDFFQTIEQSKAKI